MAATKPHAAINTFEEPPARAFARVVPPASGDPRERRAGAAVFSAEHAQVRCALDATIIPRLVQAGRGADSAVKQVGALPDTDSFARMLFERSAAELASYVDELHAAGRSVQTLYRELLAPAARRVGELWSDDGCSGAQATLAISMLHSLLHALAPRFYEEEPTVGSVHRVLLTPVPGARRACPVAMVDSFEAALTGEFFRRAGWDALTETFPTRDALQALLRREPFDVVGIVATGTVDADRVSGVLEAIHAAVRGRAVATLIAGGAVDGAAVGADAIAVDGCDAVAAARRLLAGR